MARGNYNFLPFGRVQKRKKEKKSRSLILEVEDYALCLSLAHHILLIVAVGAFRHLPLRKLEVVHKKNDFGLRD